MTVSTATKASAVFQCLTLVILLISRYNLQHSRCQIHTVFCRRHLHLSAHQLDESGTHGLRQLHNACRAPLLVYQIVTPACKSRSNPNLNPIYPQKPQKQQTTSMPSAAAIHPRRTLHRHRHRLRHPRPKRRRYGRPILCHYNFGDLCAASHTPVTLPPYFFTSKTLYYDLHGAVNKHNSHCYDVIVSGAQCNQT